MSRHVDGTPLGLVVTDAEGRVREANLAFVQMVQAESVQAVQGRPLSTWLAAAGDERVLGVHRHGLLRSRRAHLHQPDGPALLIDIAGALLADARAGCAGYTLAPMHHPCSDAGAAGAHAAALALAIESLGTDLGLAPLPPPHRRRLRLRASKPGAGPHGPRHGLAAKHTLLQRRPRLSAGKHRVRLARATSTPTRR